ncbi:MAG: GH92 family glycosyl hydrolase [Myxococcota bacterium]
MTRSTPIASALLILLVPVACDGDDGDPAPDDSDVQVTPDTPSPDAVDDAPQPEVVDGAADDVDIGPPPAEPVDLVDPLVGTGAVGINYGALYPGATRPFGMVALSPDTEGLLPGDFGVGHAGGYYYDDTEVRGFSHIHLAGTGAADYGNLSVVPAVGDPATLLAGGDVPNLPLDHDGESASPGYYRLEVADPAVTAELTATDRTGLHRYTFEPGADARIIFDATHVLGEGTIADSDLTIDGDTGEISGYVHTVGEFSSRFDGFEVFYVLRPDRAPASVGTFDADGYHDGATTVGGTLAGAVLSFDTGDDPAVELRVGVSYVDVDGARANLEAEAMGRGFDEVRDEAREVWNEALSVVEVEGGTETRRGLLYTALYHVQLMPNLVTDVDGRYRGLDEEIHEAGDFLYYTDFSMWDTYRTMHPLVTLLYPERQVDFMRTLTRMAEDGGSMPVWPLATGYTGSMIGTSADVVIADAVDKGVDDFDVESAYQAMRSLATGPSPSGKPGRDHYEDWEAHRYVPADDHNGSVSKTLEFATDDYCLSVLADHLGHADDAAMFAERATWWRNHWDDEKGFLAPRMADGTIPPYSPKNAARHYVEGNPWHYLFMIPHDVPGLAELLGGAQAFTDKLSTFMEEGREDFSMELPNPHYWHGNEPTILSPFLFGFGGRTDLARFWTHWVADTAYLPEPSGLAGNDDGGTLSAWYVFAGAGLYPLTCTGEYVHAAPLFDRVVWHLEGGDLEVRLGDDPEGTPLLNGEPIEGPTVDHDDLLGGATMLLPPPPDEVD